MRLLIAASDLFPARTSFIVDNYPLTDIRLQESLSHLLAHMSLVMLAFKDTPSAGCLSILYSPKNLSICSASLPLYVTYEVLNLHYLTEHLYPSLTFTLLPSPCGLPLYNVWISTPHSHKDLALLHTGECMANSA